MEDERRSSADEEEKTLSKHHEREPHQPIHVSSSDRNRSLAQGHKDHRSERSERSQPQPSKELCVDRDSEQAQEYGGAV